MTPESKAAILSELRNSLVAPLESVASAIATGTGMTLYDFLFIVGVGWDTAQRKHSHFLAQRALSNLLPPENDQVPS